MSPTVCAASAGCQACLLKGRRCGGHLADRGTAFTEKPTPGARSRQGNDILMPLSAIGLSSEFRTTLDRGVGRSARVRPDSGQRVDRRVLPEVNL